MKESVLSSAVVGELLREGVAGLLSAGVTNADWEARELMAAVLRESPPLVPLRTKDLLSPEARALWEKLLSERRARRPLAQVLGEWDFVGMKLQITPDVLVPRPETEELFEWMARRLPPRVFSIADVGTGSGCLAVALARRYPEVFVWAVDVSSSALAVARRNAEAQGLARRIFFLEGDLLSRFSPSLSLDAVVANLPYVDEKDMASLPPEVRYEPAVALNGGPGGLDLIRRLAVQAWERLHADGRVFFEIGHGQAPAVTELLRGLGYRDVETGKDFAGVDRFAAGTK